MSNLTKFEQSIAAAIPVDPRLAFATNQVPSLAENATTEDIVNAYVGSLFEDDNATESDTTPQADESTNNGDNKPPTDDKDTEQNKPPADNKDKEQNKPITTYEELEQCLAKRGCDPVTAIELLLSNIKPTPKLNAQLWEADVRAAGHDVHSINETIQEFLSTGMVKKSYTAMEGRLQVTLKGRSSSLSDWVRRHVAGLGARAIPAWSKEIEEITDAKARLAACLGTYNGPSGTADIFLSKGTDEQKAEKVYNILGKFSDLETSVLLDFLSDFEMLVYLASQKLAIENF